MSLLYRENAHGPASVGLVRLLPVMLALLVPAAPRARAQALQPVSFPVVMNTQVIDCSTPTVLDVGAGQTITLTGGQFIHYTDANFDGTMYATASAAGCQGISPETYYDGRAISQIRITFSKPVPSASWSLYDTLPPAQLTFDGYVPQAIFATFYDGSAAEVGQAIGTEIPSLYQILQYTYPLPVPAPFPPFTTMGLTTWDLPRNWWNYSEPAAQWSWGITSLMIPTKPDVVRFDYTGSHTADGKILISTAASDMSFPSQYQVTTPTRVSIQVQVTGTLRDGTTDQPKQGTVYLQVSDPPDTASYRGSDASVGDDFGPPGHLDNEQQGVAAVQTDSSGAFKTTLTILPKLSSSGAATYAAGDNYQITGSPNAQMTCAGDCPKSGIFTLWKRVYVEQEQMFRAGTFLRATAPAGMSIIPIDDPAPFQALTPDSSLIELVHADIAGEGFYSEPVAFHALEQATDGTWSIRTAAPLNHSYGAQATAHSAITDVMRDGVGVIDAGVYGPVNDYVGALFLAAFVDVVPAPRQRVVEVPYVPELDYLTARYFCANWLQNGAGTNLGRYASPNVFHQITAARMPLQLDPNSNQFGAELGATVIGSGSNWSAILIQRIVDLTAGAVTDRFGNAVGSEYVGLNVHNVTAETTAHETVHFWVHQPSGIDGHGHCVAQRWQHDGLNCLMHVPYRGAGLDDGFVDLHYEDHGRDSEYMAIRQAADPVPQQ